MKTYKQRTDDILEKAKKQKRNRRVAIGTAIGATAAACFMGVNCFLFIPYNTEMPSVEQYKNDEYYSVIKQLNTITYEPPEHKNNYQAILSGLSTFFDGLFFGCAGADKNLMGAAPEIMEEAYLETTDNQVAGVIEADLLKRTKEHAFYLRRSATNDGNYYYGAFDVSVYGLQGENSEQISSYKVGLEEGMQFTWVPEMYLSADGQRLTVVGECSVLKTWNDNYTVIVNLDVSDVTAIKELDRTYLSGSYSSSRSVDGKLLLINNFQAYRHIDFEDKSTYLPAYGEWGELEFVAADDVVCSEKAQSASYAVVCEIDQSTLEIEDCKALLSHSDEVYVSKDNVFVTMPYTDRVEIDSKTTETVNMTEITCLSYAGEGLECKGSFSVTGEVKNQYSMDEYEGMLRVATTYTRNKITRKNSTVQNQRMEHNANLYCIRLSDFTIAGKVEKFAPEGEGVESVRFEGEKAYVCTAEVITFTDPVYAFNLSDPTNITHVDTGVIEGYSSSLVNFGNGYLLGVGYGSHNGILKIEIYKETPTAVESVCAWEQEASFSEDYKSYFIDRENKLIGLGLTYPYNGSYNDRSAYVLLRFDGEELIPLVQTKLNGEDKYKRAFLDEGYFYIFGAEFKVQKIF